MIHSIRISILSIAHTLSNIYNGLRECYKKTGQEQEISFLAGSSLPSWRAAASTLSGNKLAVCLHSASTLLGGDY